MTSIGKFEGQSKDARGYFYGLPFADIQHLGREKTRVTLYKGSELGWLKSLPHEDDKMYGIALVELGDAANRSILQLFEVYEEDLK